MITLLAFVVTLGILITVHEYGHFQVARWCGVKVLRFSIGFGKPLWRRRFGPDQTEFVLAAIPLGGYVKMLGERETEDDPAMTAAEEARAFHRQSVWKRIAIVSAGPAANLLLAILIYWLLFMHGVTGIKPLIEQPLPDTPAAVAGIKQGELVLAVDAEPVQTWQDVRWMLLQKALKHPQVTLETRDDSGQRYQRRVTLSGISEQDIEGDLLHSLGLQPLRPIVPARVGMVVDGGAAQQADLRPGDLITQVNKVNIYSWQELVERVQGSPGRALTLDLLRDSRTMQVQVLPEVVELQGRAIGRIGAANAADGSEQQYLVETRYAPFPALLSAVAKTWETALFSLKMLASMLTGDVSWKGISGPITIADYAGQSAQVGWKSFIGFLALVSISLGVLNLLPVPVLDGGHLLYYTVEIVKGSPVSEAVMAIGQRLGILLLGSLMVLAFYNDINRLVTG
ncbi:RIP metalloprotease RseP [Methylobacillus flagellatus]|uniref:RIP metalloprotease RseP n=1 Tax=Methylobacillus flagellatus TaxID=405 RepID=UPI0010F4BA67|nr:RIP metalloprotease RseP [Methylobacillus flagellatus]